MLKSLYIKDYILIEEIRIEPTLGLNIITGETGAGKSILVDALGLILGKRADSKSVRTDSKKCIIEGVFDIQKLQLESFFKVNDLDYDDELILRREISASGKSRAFVNDSPCSLTILSNLGYQLVDIHSQHEHLLIRSQEFLFDWLNHLSNCANKQQDYLKIYKKWTAAKTELNSLMNRRNKEVAELDFWNFQLDEILELNLENQEYKALENEYELLENADQLKQKGLIAYGKLSENEGNVVDILHNIVNDLEQAGAVGSIGDSTTQLSTLIEELDDVAKNIRNEAENLEPNEERLIELNALFGTYNALLKKHQASSQDDLYNIQQDLQNKIAAHNKDASDFSKLEKSVNKLNEACKSTAKKMHELRIKGSKKIALEVEKMLTHLGLPNAKIKLELLENETLNSYGITTFNFLFSPNKGMPFSIAAKAASGGEMSRLMLILKAQLSEYKELPTLIFDEIDTGVGGEIGLKMGETIKNIAQEKQVLCITHLPQIAAKAHQHYFVYKEEVDEKTLSKIRILSKDEQVEELAKMLSGNKPTEGARINAKELLSL